MEEVERREGLMGRVSLDQRQMGRGLETLPPGDELLEVCPAPAQLGRGAVVGGWSPGDQGVWSVVWRMENQGGLAGAVMGGGGETDVD